MTGFFQQFMEPMESPLDKLLAEEDPNLERVLLSPQCFQECLSGNHGLMEFLSREVNLEVMIDLMLAPLDGEVRFLVENPVPEWGPEETPPEGVDRRARLAYAASEVFVSDAGPVLGTTAASPDLLLKIFNYLDTESVLGENRTYFSKVLTSLLRTSELASRVTEFLYEAHQSGQHDIIKSLIRHVSVTGVQQGLLTLLSPQDMVCGFDTGSQVFVRWAMDNGLPEEFLEALSSGCEETITGVLRVAVGVLSLENFNQSPELHNSLVPLLSWLSSHSHEDPSPFVPTILDLLLSRCRTDPTSQIVPLASDIIHRVARAYTFTTITPPCADDERAMTYGLQKVLEKASDFKELLSLPPPSAQPLQLQAITVAVPFGLMRLKILELVRAVSLVELKEVYMWFINEGIVPLLMELFERHPHNNMVHSLVTGILRSLVACTDPEVVAELKETANPVQWIVGLYKASKDSAEYSYHGYLFELLKEIFEKDDVVLKAGVEGLEELKEEIEAEAGRRLASKTLEVDMSSMWGEAMGMGMEMNPSGPTSNLGSSIQTIERDGEEEVTCLQLPTEVPPPPSASTTGNAWENPVTDPEVQDGGSWAAFTPPTQSPTQSAVTPESTLVDFPPPQDFSSIPASEFDPRGLDNVEEGPPSPIVSSSPTAVPEKENDEFASILQSMGAGNPSVQSAIQSMMGQNLESLQGSAAGTWTANNAGAKPKTLDELKAESTGSSSGTTTPTFEPQTAQTTVMKQGWEQF